MAILQRIKGAEKPKICSHDIMAALAEYKRGAVTAAQIVAAFDLTPAEATNLDQWLTNLDTDVINRQLIHDVLMLLEGDYYTVAIAKTRLGITND
jgi:hypothetical protein